MTRPGARAITEQTMRLREFGPWLDVLLDEDGIPPCDRPDDCETCWLFAPIPTDAEARERWEKWISTMAGRFATEPMPDRPGWTDVPIPFRRPVPMPAGNPLGPFIRAARTAQGLSQAALARRARISQNYVSLIENGARSSQLRRSTVIRLALALRLSQEDAERLMTMAGYVWQEEVT